AACRTFSNSPPRSPPPWSSSTPRPVRFPRTSPRRRRAPNPWCRGWSSCPPRFPTCAIRPTPCSPPPMRSRMPPNACSAASTVFCARSCRLILLRFAGEDEELHRLVAEGGALDGVRRQHEAFDEADQREQHDAEQRERDDAGEQQRGIHVAVGDQQQITEPALTVDELAHHG